MRSKFNLLIILASALFALAGCGKGEAPAGAAQPPKLPFATTKVQKEQVLQEQLFDATVDAVQQATLSAQTSGRITEIKFDVGDYVNKGDILLRLRGREQGASLSGAEARYREANVNFERMKDLLQQKLVSKAEYDRADAALKSASAALEQAQEQAGYTVVRAPYSGIVVRRLVEVGELASPGQPLMTGLSLDKLRVEVNLPEAYIQQVSTLSHARIIFREGDGESVGSKLTISPYADPQSHTFRVRIDLPAGEHRAYPGQFAKVAFAIAEEQLLLVPAKAIVHRSEVTGVYVVSPEGRVALRQIRLGRKFNGERLEVLAGLDVNETVALDPIQAGIYLKGQRAGNGS